MDQSPSGVEGVEAPNVVEFVQAGGLPAVPIVLGVIGHREVPIDNRKAVRDQLKSLFERFRDADPRTPLVVLTGLAEGADQMAAEVALECGVAVRAVLPFPYQIYRQSTSFDSEEAREQLDALLKNPLVESFVAALPERYAVLSKAAWLKVATDRNDPSAKKLRYDCYANVGGYIVRRCHALIAVWDSREEDPNHPSGTAEDVRFKLVGKPPAHYPWADAEPLGFRGERGLVLSIHSPKTVEPPDPSKPAVGELTILMPHEREEQAWWRVLLDRTVSACFRMVGIVRNLLGIESDSQPEPTPPHDLGWTKAPARWNALLYRKVSPWSRFGTRVRNSLGFKPSPWARKQSELTQFREICQSVRDFNRDVAGDKIARKVRGRLVDNAASHVIRTFDPGQCHWYQRFSRVREAAAVVSGQLQSTLKWVHIFLFVLIAASATAFHFYAHWFDIDLDLADPRSKHDWSWLALFTVFIGLALFLVALDWWFRLDQRRLDARALGEALRVRRAWAKAGISRSVADSYAGQLRGEFSWVRHALLHVCSPPRFWAEQFARLTKDKQLELLEEVREEWISGSRGQITHFNETHHGNHWWSSVLRTLGFVFALGGWFLAMSLLLPGREAPKAEAARPKEPAAVLKPANEAPKVEAGQLQEPPIVARKEKGAARDPGGPAYPSDASLIISSLLVIFGGLLIAYSERQGHEELSRQFERMEIVFRNADKELLERLCRDIAGAQKVIEELGREAITEHAGWYMHRRARSLELHIG